MSAVIDTNTLSSDGLNLDGVPRPHRVCTRCVMDTSDPLIRFDADGICNHCSEFEARRETRLLAGAEGARQLSQIVEKIKRDGRGKEYDCIAGVSGGVDSTYVAYQAKQLGLRPLAIHFDNGWNSELAVSNIQTALNKLQIDLSTYVVDWEEFRDLQLSFLRASTPDAEVPTDHAIYAALIQNAVKRGIKYVLNGMNFASEGISVPAWAYGHSDWRYISGVHTKFGSRQLKTYPHYSLPYLAYALGLRGVKFVSILNYIQYDKQQAMNLLEEKLDWRPYSGKHHESIYTRFFQCYILPRKFGIDKRKAHLSNLIHSGTGGITREKALAELREPPCDARLIAEDLIFVRKKLGLSEAQFDAIMELPAKSYHDYPNSAALVQLAKRLQHRLRGAGIFYR